METQKSPNGQSMKKNKARGITFLFQTILHIYSN